jgi:hypothetical protein
MEDGERRFIGRLPLRQLVYPFSEIDYQHADDGSKDAERDIDISNGGSLPVPLSEE